MRARLLAALLSICLSAAAHAALLEHVPLQWKPTSRLRLGSMQMPLTPIRFEPFGDVRPDRHSIGENREDEAPRPVTTNDDVGAFVSAHMRELFDRAGLKTVDRDGAVTVKGEVRRFFARETSLYRSEVAVHVEVVDRGGRTLWSGVASGEAKRFGRSYRLENYEEVLSDALVNAVSSMLQSPQFLKALSGG